MGPLIATSGAAPHPVSVLDVLLAIAGAVLALATATSLVSTLLIPRGRVSLLMRVVDRVVVGAYRLLLARVRGYGRRDAVLASQAPVVLVGQLTVWLLLFHVSYTLLLMPAHPTLAHAAREAASSMLTLGFTSTHGGWATFVDSLAAVTGLVSVALQISYLPTLYAAFNRRETEVTLLTVRAGEPAWGPELLARTHYGVLGVDLAAFFGAWERWAADIAESHASYPVLLRFRSPRPLSSWVVALLAVLDAGAMQVALNPASTPPQVRLCLRMGFVALRRLAGVVGAAVDDDPRPDAPVTLTFEEFQEGCRRLEAVGFEVERTPEQAWPHFRGWRVNYEAAAFALALELDAVPARWSGPRRGHDEVIMPVRPPNRTPEQPHGGPGLMPR